MIEARTAPIVTIVVGMAGSGKSTLMQVSTRQCAARSWRATGMRGALCSR